MVSPTNQARSASYGPSVSVGHALGPLPRDAPADHQVSYPHRFVVLLQAGAASLCGSPSVGPHLGAQVSYGAHRRHGHERPPRNRAPRVPEGTTRGVFGESDLLLPAS